MVTMSFSSTPRLQTYIGVIAASLALAACGGGAKSATPTQLSTSATDYDGQSVSVSGTAKDPHVRTTKRGQMVRYQLCDSACVNVVQFGDTSVADGTQVTVTGFFHQSFGRIRKISNVVVVGGRRPNS
jgi:hypothetical protein